KERQVFDKNFTPTQTTTVQAGQVFVKNLLRSKWNEELYSSTTLAVAYNSNSFSHKNNKTSKKTTDTARRPQKSLNCSDWNLSTTTLQNSIIFDQ
uniref:Uncharacterized protein n=1 Tax=Glossina palpalis gambiensis TaxID=67801 RepID=A0A1B0ATN2_9MUSC